MKKSFLSFLLFSTMGFSLYAQNFTQVTRSSAGQQVSLSQDQVLEVKLAATPSNGYGWYLKSGPDSRQTTNLTQVGDWEFKSDNAANAVGAAGTQTIRFVGAAKGAADLELVYIRPWETGVEPLDSYKVTVSTEGSYTGSYKAPEPAKVQAVPYKSSLSLPSSYSLQAQCTSVKDQGQCGSCWTFAACGSFEASIKMKDRVDRDLSEQWLVNCDKKSQGCDGGYCPDYLFVKGAVYEADAKYKGVNGTCASSYTYHEKIDSYLEIANTVDAIKQAIMQYGPVWSTVCVGNNFQNYKAGTVLTKTDGDQNDHAIVLCGWDDATSSWILKNSWAASWGSQGYMKIGYGVCNVGEATTYLVYKGGFTGTNDISLTNSAVNIYPNPAANGKFSISGLEKENTIEVYDVVGKLVYKTLATSDKISVDLSGNQKGVYLYRIINANNSIKQGKVVVL